MKRTCYLFFIFLLVCSHVVAEDLQVSWVSTNTHVDKFSLPSSYRASKQQTLDRKAHV